MQCVKLYPSLKEGSPIRQHLTGRLGTLFAPQQGGWAGNDQGKACV